ncbi:MAG: MBL fold metallo-hydrolase, partial [Spirochaetaceae bacterium]|nr:MBL fold metallo-hydrolase [Spirochaetaceae bacterium]
MSSTSERSQSGSAMHLRWSGCGGFEARFPSVNVAFDPYYFDEALTAAEPVYDYIFITHEHFDHCHPPTLERLCRGDRFRRLYVSPGCVYPAQPVDEVYGDAAFERDLPITKSIPADRVQVLYPTAKSSLIGGDREFPANAGLDLHGMAVEVVESGESASRDLPTCGYLVTDLASSVSIYHTGDLHEPYPELAALAGRGDYLLPLNTRLPR